jgi:hypothetical protein
MMNATRAARLKEFLKRLRLAEPAHGHDEALKLVAGVLNAVEDEMTLIPYDPIRWQSDGRMYPPQPDAVRDVPGFPTVKRYRSVGHNTFIADNGAIQIAVPPPPDGGRIVLSKRGADGKHLVRR